MSNDNKIDQETKAMLAHLLDDRYMNDMVEVFKLDEVVREITNAEFDRRLKGE